MVMADRGFDIQHLLASTCVTLNIPPSFFFFARKEQLSLIEEVETRNIASIVFMWSEQLNG